ncbi:MAG TPA: hypothetical protein VHP14_24885 [Anaerolineales bacterium]|nr:hypothetical protein [Anaerolineales bacterium]
MKKSLIILLTLFSILALTACGTSRSTQPGTGSAPQGGPEAGALSSAAQLIVGTLKLDGTPQAVTAEQAKELLPLWQTLLVLANSDTAANQEKEALIAQIQETMTAEQMQAIQAMNLTRADMAGIIQQQGPAMGNSQNGGQNSTGRGEFPGGGPGGGGMPGGGPPGGMPGGGMPGGGGGFSGQGQNVSAEQIATAQAARQANENFVPPMLINAVIEYLKKTAGA